jgi:alpha-L-fucosidase
MSSTTERSSGRTGWFTDARFGMFIHWGTYALAARHEWVKNHEQIDELKYRKYFDHFCPDLFDPKEWARIARDAGMKYFVITAKHHEGFCLWDTSCTDYKAGNTPFGKDLLRPVIEAFREEGLRIGIYYSLLDWHHPDFTVDTNHPMRNNNEERTKNKSREMKRYAEYMRNQVTELLTNYGPIDIIWFDFSYPGPDGKGCDDWESKKLFDLVRKLQPSIMINNRLDLLTVSGDFVTPEQFQPAAPMVDQNGNPVVWEACQTFSNSWGYHRDELTWKPVDTLLRMLIDGVSKNGNMLLNVGPTARGEFDYRARERLEGIGRWMKYHSRSIYGCGAAPKEFIAPADCRYTLNARTNRLYLHLFAWPFKHVFCPGLEGKIEYAQFLHDASEVVAGRPPELSWPGTGASREPPPVLNVPLVKPNTEIPVIEIFLK